MAEQKAETPDWEELEAQLQNGVYAAAVAVYEKAEHARLIHGNGHHMAQEMARIARDLLRDRRLKPKP